MILKDFCSDRNFKNRQVSNFGSIVEHRTFTVKRSSQTSADSTVRVLSLSHFGKHFSENLDRCLSPVRIFCLVYICLVLSVRSDEVRTVGTPDSGVRLGTFCDMNMAVIERHQMETGGSNSQKF